MNWHFSHQCISKNLVSKVCDGLISIVHSHSNTTLTFEIEDFSDNWFASSSRSEDKFKLSRSWELNILALVLITIRVSSDNERLLPAWNESGNVFADDWLSEDSSVENGPDCTVRRFPHFLQLKLLHSLLIRSNSSAFDTNFVL